MIRAIADDDYEGFKALVEAGHPMDQDENGFGVYAIHCAARKSDQRFIKLLLDHGANVNQPWYTCGTTPLFVACLDGNIDMIRFLLPISEPLNLSLMWHGSRTTGLLYLLYEGYKIPTNPKNSPVMNNVLFTIPAILIALRVLPQDLCRELKSTLLPNGD